MLSWLFTIATAALLLLYLGWQWRSYYWWRRGTLEGLPESEISLDRVGVTILIPARNEEGVIGNLLSDLLIQTCLGEQDEIIVINDHSSDATSQIAASFDDPRIQTIDLADFIDETQLVAHKKAAITTGVTLARNEWIVMTDADCHWPPEVLTTIKNQAGNSGVDLICGPVLVNGADNPLTGFQGLDLLAYIFLTAAYTHAKRPILANGAHLSFRKELFERIGGYAGIDHIPSGDDVLLLQKVRRESPASKVSYLASSRAVVYTEAMTTWSDFWRQRFRWAGKSGHYDSPDLTFAQGVSFLVAAMLVAGTLVAFFLPLLRLPIIVFWLLKGSFEYLILRQLANYYHQKSLLKFYPFATVFQPFYLLTVGIATLLGIKVRWSGRKH
ncbi:hypothetical protein CEQ90_06305 [Lewinellaceae bacterium SD302]|nr:hypothetical protein CEQ90_06305 [Lewinellaceae bacterium SD302]